MCTSTSHREEFVKNSQIYLTANISKHLTIFFENHIFFVYAQTADYHNSKGLKMTKVNITKKTVWDTTKYLILLILLSFIRALSTHVFTIPNGFAPGGVSGISSIIYNAVLLGDNAHLAHTVFSPGLTTFVINIPLLVLAFFTLNRRFAVNTLLVVGAYSGFMSLFSAVDFPQFFANGDTGIMLLAAIAGGVISGVCLGIMLRHNMSLGGTDIIGKLIYKHNPSADTQWWIFACDAVVALASGSLGLIKLDASLDATAILTKVLSPIFYSYISLFTASKAADFLQAGLQSSIVFNIISDKADDIAEEISNTLHRGTTISKAVGHYTNQEHEVLVCVVSKKQINVVKNIISRIDPNAFTYIMKAGEVAGKGFRRSVDK